MILSVILLAAMIFNIASCSMLSLNISATDLMDGITPGNISGKNVNDKFIANTTNFYVELFKKTIKEDENSLISPLSVMLALSMTANGADNDTLTQMQTLLGGDIALDELNEYLYSYVSSLPSESKSKLDIANSIWFRDEENRLTVKKDFLQKNADYYKAAAYKAAFDSKTLDDINGWVKDKTDGMIEKILDEIREDAVMYLINAVVFDAEWKTVYSKENVMNGQFTSIKGEKQNVDFMFSEEKLYLDDGKATGFIKPYAGDKYSFAALLPNENVPINDYISSLTGEGFSKTVKNAKTTAVSATMPKFSYDYTILMNDALKSLGMTDAFDGGKADLSRLGSSTRGNLYIGEVLHKTFISVDELGTKAGAVTKVEIRDEAYYETKTVKLDRPFVYAIIDNATGLPVFMGTVMSIEG